MGQIQNAINAGIGSIIASKAMAEHLQSQALNNIQSQYTEAKDIGKQAEELQKQSYENDMARQAAEDFKKESQEKLEIKHPRDEKSGRFVNKKEYQRKLDMDIDKATEKLKELSKEQDAISAQKEMFFNRIEMYNKRNVLVQNSINRLPANKRIEPPDIDKILSNQEKNAVITLKGSQKKENK